MLFAVQVLRRRKQCLSLWVFVVYLGRIYEQIRKIREHFKALILIIVGRLG